MVNAPLLFLALFYGSTLHIILENTDQFREKKIYMKMIIFFLKFPNMIIVYDHTIDIIILETFSRVRVDENI